MEDPRIISALFIFLKMAYYNVLINNIRLSNPSYVKMSEIRNLIKQLKDNAPAFSLDGVQDGLYFFRKILSRVREFLRVGDYIIFENGENQSEELQKYLCSTILELLKG